jgi:hypothetical protein
MTIAISPKFEHRREHYLKDGVFDLSDARKLRKFTDDLIASVGPTGRAEAEKLYADEFEKLEGHVAAGDVLTVRYLETCQKALRNTERLNEAASALAAILKGKAKEEPWSSVLGPKSTVQGQVYVYGNAKAEPDFCLYITENQYFSGACHRAQSRALPGPGDPDRPLGRREHLRRK